MKVIGKWKIRFGFGLAAAVLASVVSTSAFAYTPEEQQACQGDAFQFCGPEIPDVDRVTACMVRNKARLSPGCRQYFRSGPEPEEVEERKARKPKKPAKPAAS
jgi:hypothetical protein